MSAVWNLSSSRARQAKIASALGSKNIKIAIVVLYVLFFIAGTGLVVTKNPLGWALLGFSAWPAMLLVWHEWLLKVLPPAAAGETIDALADADLLGLLRPGFSPSQLVGCALRTNGGLFFALRLGIG